MIKSTSNKLIIEIETSDPTATVINLQSALVHVVRQQSELNTSGKNPDPFGHMVHVADLLDAILLNEDQILIGEQKMEDISNTVIS